MSEEHAGRKKYKFFVDGKQYEVDKKTVSGAEIRGIADVDPNYQLFLEEPGAEKPDRQIANDYSVDLEEPGVEKFYTIPPATFGANCHELP
jgi:Multiubiquitin